MTGPVLQSCRACGHRWQFVRAACPLCAAPEVEEIRSAGSGTVWSATTVLRAPLPELDVSGGYGIALVTLNEGPRVMCRADAGLAIGDRVNVAVDERGLPRASRA